MKIHHVVMLVILILFTGCAGKKESVKPCISVSTEPLAWLLAQIAEDDIEITTLIPGGINPETYNPTPGTMKALAGSSAFFTLDTPGFEKNLVNTISTNFPGMLITDVSEGIDKIYGTHAETTESGDGFDPHMLNSVKNCIQIAKTMTGTLSKMYPEKREEYAQACEDLAMKLSELDSDFTAKNLKGKTILVRHPILTYFARDYGIRQIALEKEGKEPTPLQLSSQIGKIRESIPSLAVIEPTGGKSIEREIADELDIPIIEVNLATGDWIKELTRIADEIGRN